MDKENIDISAAKPPEGLEQLTLGANIKVWLPKGDKEAAKKAIQLIKLYSGIEEAIHGMKEVLTVKEVSSVKDVRELEEQ